MADVTEPGPDARPIAPYGSWPSPLRVDDLLADYVRLAEPWIDGDDLYWTEGRPTDGGRNVLVRREVDGTITDLTRAPFDVRTRVHEYGGGAYIVAGGTIAFSNVADGRLYRLDPGVATPVAITPEGPFRYADLRVDPVRRRFVAIREDHGVDGEPAAAIVAIPLDGDRDPVVLYEGPDFLAAPRPSPDGTRLAWLEWDHPDMPWDATRLRVATFGPDGTLEPSVLAAGGPDESVVQPEWSPDGTLHLVSDRSGWWNLYRVVEGPRLEPLAPMDAEFAGPTWTFGKSWYAFLPDGSIAATMRRGGRDQLVHVAPGQLVGEIASPYTEFDWLRTSPAGAVALAASPTDPAALVTLDPATLAPSGILRRSTSAGLDASMVAVPESISFPSVEGRTAHALFYPPTNDRVSAPTGERPPLLVRSHGGPTANVTSALSLDTQFFTSRGIAVVDVDFGGSTGYGRDYRRLLDGGFGVVDVEDSIAAARYLVARGDVDGDRLAIEGGSSGGYTTLCALAFHDAFTAGISLYGIADLETLARDTHKFEARYLDRLVGPYPAMADRYRQRSPVHYLDEVGCPVLILQGLDDRVVPPSQADALVAALAANGIPHAYLAFEGEGHGFRGAEAIRAMIESRLAFLGAVFGFVPADDLRPLELPGLDTWQARRHAEVSA